MQNVQQHWRLKGRQEPRMRGRRLTRSIRYLSSCLSVFGYNVQRRILLLSTRGHCVDVPGDYSREPCCRTLNASRMVLSSEFSKVACLCTVSVSMASRGKRDGVRPVYVPNFRRPVFVGVTLNCAVVRGHSTKVATRMAMAHHGWERPPSSHRERRDSERQRKGGASPK